MEEIRKRIRGATFVWQKLQVFWRDGLLSKRERIIIYDALVGSKLLFGLHRLPLHDASLNRLNVFHLRGLRRILGLPTTYIDRAYPNKRVLEIAEEEANRAEEGQQIRKWKRIKLVSEILVDRSRDMLGEVLRQDPTDLMRQVTFRDETSCPNLPGENRVGRPKTHWALSNMRRIWDLLELNKRHADTAGANFNHRNEMHLHILLEAAQMKDF